MVRTLLHLLLLLLLLLLLILLVHLLVLKPLKLAAADDCGWSLAGEQSWKNPMDMDSDEEDDTPKEEEAARTEPEPEPVRTPYRPPFPRLRWKSLSLCHFG